MNGHVSSATTAATIAPNPAGVVVAPKDDTTAPQPASKNKPEAKESSEHSKMVKLAGLFDHNNPKLSDEAKKARTDVIYDYFFLPTAAKLLQSMGRRAVMKGMAHAHMNGEDAMVTVLLDLGYGEDPKDFSRMAQSLCRTFRGQKYDSKEMEAEPKARRAAEAKIHRATALCDRLRPLGLDPIPSSNTYGCFFDLLWAMKAPVKQILEFMLRLPERARALHPPRYVEPSAIDGQLPPGIFEMCHRPDLLYFTQIFLKPKALLQLAHRLPWAAVFRQVVEVHLCATADPDEVQLDDATLKEAAEALAPLPKNSAARSPCQLPLIEQQESEERKRKFEALFQIRRTPLFRPQAEIVQRYCPGTFAMLPDHVRWVVRPVDNRADARNALSALIQGIEFSFYQWAKQVHMNLLSTFLGHLYPLPDIDPQSATGVNLTGLIGKEYTKDYKICDNLSTIIVNFAARMAEDFVLGDRSDSNVTEVLSFMGGTLTEIRNKRALSNSESHPSTNNGL